MGKQRKSGKLCWSYQRGACANGTNCNFVHAREQQTNDFSTGGWNGTLSAKDADLQQLTAQLVDLVEKVRHGPLIAEVDRLSSALESTCAKNVGLEEQLRVQVAKTEDLERKLANAAVELTELRDRLRTEAGQKAELSKKLVISSSEQSRANPKSGAEWQFSTGPTEWSSYPANRSEELQACFEEYSKKGGPALVCMRSGVEEYEIDLSKMQQTNVKTRKTRPIRCTFNTPAHWTRSCSLDAIYHTEPTESVELSGLTFECLNGVYMKDISTVVNGHPVWWNTLGDTMMYHWPETNLLCIDQISESYPEVRSGNDQSASAFLRGGGPDPCKKEGWQEWMECVDAKLVVPASVVVSSPTSSGVAPLMSIAVEVSDARMMSELTVLLSDTVRHQDVCHGASACDSFKNGVKLIRVLRIENWHLWMKYRNHAEQIKRDLLKDGVQAEAVEPRLPPALETFSAEYGDGVDAAFNEHLLFHGTSYETAVQIALEGFDFRLSNPGYYGQGTYFGSQACKSHQYTKPRRKVHTMLLSRVALGDVHYAEKVDKECRRPPLRKGTARCCDSVVAKPGPMPGHTSGTQTHQEFVIFDKFQAYPELILQYVVEP